MRAPPVSCSAQKTLLQVLSWSYNNINQQPRYPKIPIHMTQTRNNMSQKVYSNVLQNLRTLRPKGVTACRTALPAFRFITNPDATSLCICSPTVLKSTSTASETSDKESSEVFSRSANISIRRWLANPFTIHSRCLNRFIHLCISHLVYRFLLFHSNVLQNVGMK